MTDDRRAARTVATLLRRWILGSGEEAADVLGAVDALALEIVTALRMNGWRPTPATRPHPWHPTPGEALGPDIVHACAAQVRQALTEALERAAQTEGTHAATDGGTT